MSLALRIPIFNNFLKHALEFEKKLLSQEGVFFEKQYDICVGEAKNPVDPQEGGSGSKMAKNPSTWFMNAV